METNYFSEETLNQAVELLQKGELVAFPTETVYGLGADATNAEAVQKVYQAKGRPSDNPLIVHVTGQEDLTHYVESIPVEAKKLMDSFWPGPLTLIFKIIPGSLPSVVTGGLETAAFRMPANDLTLALIEQVGAPLVGPSANTSGKPSPTTAKHVMHDLAGKIAGILEGGATSVGLESTVLDMSGDVPMILRPGQLTEVDLEQVIGEVTIDRHLMTETEAPKSPGMKYKHYSPNVEVWMIDYLKADFKEAVSLAKKDHLNVGVLASEKIVSDLGSEITASYILTSNGTVSEAAKHLFAGLRALDEWEEPLDLVLVETFPEIGVGAAYMNRLKKASGGKIFKC
ncbi:L-threonylcarbamoyladenylate synthase [Vagococcus intermedius]|uniref:Threonylcarbamoyl-AMP synthase n=1 Tax=Vagococcus intermedius TaxID=2991418 RepID=A0AAF0I6X6_9ENTE|nr:L-threonylcarbamoyladenylate synthase [Vagococcus intermedius]WEG72960.1 L-threonylcarbamoyladenylate synthase [Vagococcus intermedius]WEG75046.1 L-threonylcarbamoyladenylate synthase [Vagococcus intermedius]